MRYVLLSLLALAYGAGQANAQGVKVYNAKITEYGIFSTSKVGQIKAKNTSTGTATELSNIHLVKRTRIIPGTLGTRFGFRCKFNGSPKGGSIRITKKTLIPSPGMRNPKTGKLTTTSFYNLTVKLGGTRYFDYGFDHAWEIVPGQWTQQIWYKNKLLCSVAFEIGKP